MIYRFNGKLFKLRRSEAKSKVEGLDQVSEDCDNYDLKISTRKIEVVYQQAT